jgi:hypothetical protein
LREGPIAGNVPRLQPDPGATGQVRRKAHRSTPERTGIRAVDSVAINLRPVARDQLDEFERKRPGEIRAYIGLLAGAAAVLTPGPDISSMVFLSIPMMLLYELGILLVGKSRPLPAV